MSKHLSDSSEQRKAEVYMLSALEEALGLKFDLDASMKKKIGSTRWGMRRSTTNRTKASPESIVGAMSVPQTAMWNPASTSAFGTPSRSG